MSVLSDFCVYHMVCFGRHHLFSCKSTLVQDMSDFFDRPVVFMLADIPVIQVQQSGFYCSPNVIFGRNIMFMQLFVVVFQIEAFFCCVNLKTIISESPERTGEC